MGCMMLSMRLEIVCTRARVSAFAAHLMVILWCELALQANSKTIIYLFICFIAFVCICYSIYDLYVCDFPFKFLDAPNWWKKPSKLLRSKTIDELKQVNVFSLEWPAHPVIILNSECSYSAFNRPPPFSLLFHTFNVVRCTPYMCQCRVSVICAYFRAGPIHGRCILCIAHSRCPMGQIDLYTSVIMSLILTANMLNRHSSHTKCNARREDVLCRFNRFYGCSIWNDKFQINWNVWGNEERVKKKHPHSVHTVQCKTWLVLRASTWKCRWTHEKRAISSLSILQKKTKLRCFQFIAFSPVFTSSKREFAIYSYLAFFFVTLTNIWPMLLNKYIIIYYTRSVLNSR